MRFNIEGEPMPVVVCELESGEMMITEKGAINCTPCQGHFELV